MGLTAYNRRRRRLVALARSQGEPKGPALDEKDSVKDSGVKKETSETKEKKSEQKGKKETPRQETVTDDKKDLF